jgi:4-amino-4-deoxy-L-arabinose transferase-like glycosyltransferase
MTHAAQDRRECFPVLAGAVLVLAVCSIVFFSGLRNIPFYEKGEPREGLVVWEIWHNGNWILPLRAGTQIPSKPPLFHWIAALASLSAGSFNEFTVRFPSPLLATLGVLLTYLVAVRLWGLGAGIAAAVVLATSPEWWRAATTARVDMTLTFFMLCTFLYFYFLYKSGGGLGKSLLLAFFAGLATLAKGPVGAALPGIAALLFLGLKRDFAFIKRLHLPLAVPFGLIVAGAWYLLALEQGGEKFFLRQIVHEIIGTPLGGAGHNHNVFYYVPALVAGMAPWSLFFPALAIFLFHERRRLAEEELLYPLAWFGAVFIVLSIALGKRPVYILPLYPAVALLFGAWWRRLGDGGFSTRWTKIGAIATASLLGIGAAALLTHALGWNLFDTAAPLLRPKDREGLSLVASAMQRHRLVILLYAAFSALAAFLLIYAAQKNYWRHVLAAVAASMVVLFWLVQNIFHPALAAQYSFKPFMERAQKEAPLTAPVIFYRGANKAAAFYARVYFPAFQQTRPAKPPFFMLISEDDWLALRGQKGLTELDASETTGWEGRQRLFLVRVGDGAKIRLPENAEPSEENAEPSEENAEPAEEEAEP